MREILYRGRDFKGEWHQGYFTRHRNIQNKVDTAIHIYDEVEGDTYCDGLRAVDETTVGLYTGLTDRLCNKIFEGDIVKCHRYANGKDGELVFENLVVVWDDMDACFGLAEVGVGHISYRYNDYQMDDTHEFEVIGNIFDNPELLKPV